MPFGANRAAEQKKAWTIVTGCRSRLKLCLDAEPIIVGMRMTRLRSRAAAGGRPSGDPMHMFALVVVFQLWSLGKEERPDLSRSAVEAI